MSSISHFFGTRTLRGQKASVVDAAFAVDVAGMPTGVLGTVGTRQVVTHPGNTATGCKEQGQAQGQEKRQNTPIPDTRAGMGSEQPTE